MTDKANEAYETLLEFLYMVPVALLQVNDKGAIDMLNPMAAQLLMPLAPDGRMDNLFAVLEPLAPELAATVHDFAPPSGVVCESVRIDIGHVRPEHHGPQVLSASILKLDAQRFMVVLADATRDAEREQQTLLRELNDAARIDGLTRMPNRSAVRETLQRMIDQAPPEARDFAVLFINCDRFKQVNDSFGNATGDHILRTIAERLRQSLRRADLIGSSQSAPQMAARFSGDEFVVILDGPQHGEHAASVARRTLAALELPYRVDGHEIVCNFSIGIVVPDASRADADMLLQDASIAMAEAKRAGGSRHALFDPAMRERAQKRGGMEAELRQALLNRHLHVVYQPIVGLQQEEGRRPAAGAEALVRWHHPLKGSIPPPEFIGIAEECGLIGILGEFVLESACADFMDWKRRLGPDAPALLAVNLSRAQLTDAGLVQRVQQILHSTGMAPDALQLEITESLAAQDDIVQQRLRDLKALGIKLALDDFGTGYSSLSCLHMLPVDTVKIDRSFVCQADISPHHRVLIEATVRVAHSLNMNTVAEGVETPAQAAVIRELHCDKGQGYLYSRPLGKDQFQAWIAERLRLAA
ncbi:putative bifunctional diguanylate cyclase/phosphodiesterase [Noviherbaspirillum aerium]|uniref:putative bifunctional diguanylate cyclase/phosphodiesterase n=1 Tax=Noviherbaspirillum aerium TaxID=2588497 RepID=UPI00124F30AC|nr:bifunctional diguanylate cyclase/phosphodiesterase [Noviherbaspirillum aerium]